MNALKVGVGRGSIEHRAVIHHSALNYRSGWMNSRRGYSVVGKKRTMNTTNSSVNMTNAYRLYHASRRREILPVIAAGVLTFTIYYSYRAVARMGEERAEYEEYLERIGVKKDGTISTNSHTAPGILGVDFGTSSVRVAINTGDKPVIVEDPVGDRSTPAYLYNDTDTSSMVVGKVALSKLHAGPQDVISPFDLLSSTDPSSAEPTSLLLREILSNAIDKRSAGTIGDVETVLTHPPSFTPEQTELLVNAGRFAGLSDPYVVAEPVATVIAAESLGVISAEQKSKPILVADFGHATSSFSIVSSDQVQATNTVPFAGAAIQSLLVSHLSSQFSKQNKSINLLDDKIAKQRLHDAASTTISELAIKSRTDVDLPFITADASGPKHLQDTVSITVLNQLANERVGEHLESKDLGSDVNALVIQSIMKSLTEAGLTPMDLSTILVVGGASRQPIFHDAVKNAASMLGGEDFSSRVVKIVGGELTEELTALGACISVKGE